MSSTLTTQPVSTSPMTPLRMRRTRSHFSSPQFYEQQLAVRQNQLIDNARSFKQELPIVAAYGAGFGALVGGIGALLIPLLGKKPVVPLKVLLETIGSSATGFTGAVVPVCMLFSQKGQRLMKQQNETLQNLVGSMRTQQSQ